MKLKSPNAVHVCMVFEVLSENLLGSDQNKGAPVLLVRRIAKQMLLDLDYVRG
jgi:serine/threonine-protein kinase SRPK3